MCGCRGSEHEDYDLVVSCRRLVLLALKIEENHFSEKSVGPNYTALQPRKCLMSLINHFAVER
jgi:hypothetical protein